MPSLHLVDYVSQTIGKSGLERDRPFNFHSLLICAPAVQDLYCLEYFSGVESIVQAFRADPSFPII